MSSFSSLHGDDTGLIEHIADYLTDVLADIGIDPDAPAPDRAHCMSTYIAACAVDGMRSYENVVADVGPS